ncbi:helix-turn-helix transcriptional regulator [uncultured Agathobaculum sp.]|uniref:helix-turn-helix domain-containing protein n=1 Tax=uncultured Agathobaculum sp. TaxID=2048140 RepID=UPI00296E5725
MTTGEKIAALRRENSMSQEALGEKLGLSRQAVSKWEADQAVPTMDNLMELSKLFGVSVDTLLRPDAELTSQTENTADKPEESRPAVPRKWKIAAIAAAGLLCVSVACSAVSLWRVIVMQQQIDTLRMQSGPSTIYYPDNTSAENSDLADWSENVTVDRQNTDNLLVTVSAVPRSMMDGETAKFVVRSGDQSWECDTEFNNGYSGKLSVPFVDTFSVYLTLAGTSGETRNLLVASEYDLKQRFSLEVRSMWENGSFSFNGKTTSASGNIQTYIYCGDDSVTPVSGRILLYQNGRQIKEKQMENLDAGSGIGDAYYYTQVDWRNLEGGFEQYQLKAEITDNYGRVYSSEFF